MKFYYKSRAISCLTKIIYNYFKSHFELISLFIKNVSVSIYFKRNKYLQKKNKINVDLQNNATICCKNVWFLKKLKDEQF